MISIEKARNLGPVSGVELSSVGIDTLEKLVDVGWEAAFELWVRSYPERVNLNACAALIGAVEDLGWRQIPPPLKAEAGYPVKSFKRK